MEIRTVVRQGSLLTREQLASLLGVSTMTILRMERQRRLKAIRISPRCIRYRIEDVEHLLDSKRAA